MSWPDDAEGAVLRRLQSAGFDFERPVWIDFNVAFADAASDLALRALSENLPEAMLTIFADEILVRVESRLTYPFVVAMQERLSSVARPYGGACNTWGVLLPPASS